MVRGGSRGRDLSLDTNSLQNLQSVWFKDSREEQRAMALDPRKTWRAFIENSKRQKEQRRARKNRRRNNRKNQIPVPREGPVGPPGRRGPAGPQGPPGGTLSTREMEEYIRDYLAEYLRQNNTINNTLHQEGQGPGRGRVRAAFVAILPHPAILKPSALSVVDSFTITFTPGVFERRMVLEHGGFTAVRRGIYQVTASLILHPLALPGPPAPHQPPRDISVYLCITTCTRDRRRLEWSGGLGEGSVTAVLVGHVMLLRGDTLLLAVDNPTKRPLQAGTGSSFSAALIGT
ncbi:hypothetical protein Pcinc_033016 [Petrolisthes cinctipes]|uniref:Erythroferrone n=1 Tax=Petrolisthes cinctipes TaxID=88211 RepID=A0AAE1ET20_PETCI|nr:hypothetical protein Pcinc_033016 [Petrolisthes cinctipes]